MKSNLFYKVSALILFIACICLFIQYQIFSVKKNVSEKTRATPPQNSMFLTNNEVSQYLLQAGTDTPPGIDNSNFEFEKIDSAALILMYTSKSASFEPLHTHSVEYDFLKAKFDLHRYLENRTDTTQQK